MKFCTNAFFHIYNRSFERTVLFQSDRNYRYFIQKLQGLKSSCSILAYCLMPDHFHLLIYLPESPSPTEESDLISGSTMHPLSRKIGTILSSYTQAINKQRKRNGSLFQPKTKAKKINTEEYLHTVFHYIHQNPIRAGLTSKLTDWEYSSFHEYYHNKYILADCDAGKMFINMPFKKELFLKCSTEAIPGTIT